MKKNPGIFFCISAAIFASCQKTGFGSVEGTVRDSYTNQPIQGADINLVWLDGTYSGNKNWEKSATSDLNGHYKISFYKRTNRTYDLTATAGAYWGQSKTVSLNRRKTDTDIYLDPIAYIRYRVINNTSNAVTIVIGDYKERFLVRSGMDTLSQTNHKANGNGTTYIDWQLGEFPNQISYHDKVNISSGALTVVTYTININ